MSAWDLLHMRGTCVAWLAMQECRGWWAGMGGCAWLSWLVPVVGASGRVIVYKRSTDSGFAAWGKTPHPMRRPCGPGAARSAPGNPHTLREAFH